MAQALKGISLRIGQLIMFTTVIGLLLHVPVNVIIALLYDFQLDLLIHGVLIIFISLFTIAIVNIMSDIIFRTDTTRFYSKLAMGVIIIVYSFWKILL